MYFICFRFCLLESVSHCEESSIIHSSRNFETTCCTDWHSCQKCQTEDFRVFGCKFEDRFIYPVHIMGFGVVTSNNDIVSVHLPTWSQTQHKLISSAWKDSVGLDREVSNWKILCLATRLCAILNKLENSVLISRKFLRAHHP